MHSTDLNMQNIYIYIGFISKIQICIFTYFFEVSELFTVQTI